MSFRALHPLSLILIGACNGPPPPESTTPGVASFTVTSGGGPARAVAGDIVSLTIRATLDSGWKIYSLTQQPGGPTPLSFAVAPAPLFQLAAQATGPAAKVQRDATFGIDTETYDGAPGFVVPIRVADSAAAGRRTIEMTVKSQACSDTVCLDAETTTLKVPVIIVRKQRPSPAA